MPNPNAYGDPLICGYTLSAAGTYFVELQGSQSGLYEFFAVVPEPSSCALLAIGLAGCGGLAWLRKRQRG